MKAFALLDARRRRWIKASGLAEVELSHPVNQGLSLPSVRVYRGIEILKRIFSLTVSQE